MKDQFWHLYTCVPSLAGLIGWHESNTRLNETLYNEQMNFHAEATMSMPARLEHAVWGMQAFNQLQEANLQGLSGDGTQS